MQITVNDPWQELANNIVLQAVVDYRRALCGMGYKHKTAERVVQECERFFHSHWFGMLTKLSGEALVERIKEKTCEEVEHEQI